MEIDGDDDFEVEESGEEFTDEELAAAELALAEESGEFDEYDPAAEEATWRDLISDAKLRNSVEKYSSVEDLIKAHNHLGGELRNRIKYPDVDSSDEEVMAFREAMGVPDDPDEYPLPEIEGYEYSEDDLVELEGWAEWALENNIPQGAFMELIRSRVENKAAVDMEHHKILQAEQELAEHNLRQEWGGDYEANIEYAARAAHAYGGEELVEALESIETDEGQLLGDIPAIVKFLSNVGRMSAEHDPSMITTDGERQTVSEQISQIMSDNPPGTPGYNSPGVQRRLGELYEMLEGNKLISP